MQQLWNIFWDLLFFCIILAGASRGSNQWKYDLGQCLFGLWMEVKESMNKTQGFHKMFLIQTHFFWMQEIINQSRTYFASEYWPMCCISCLYWLMFIFKNSLPICTSGPFHFVYTEAELFATKQYINLFNEYIITHFVYLHHLCP